MQTTQWLTEKGQKDIQRYTKHTNKTKDRVTRTPLKTGGEFRCLLNKFETIHRHRGFVKKPDHQTHQSIYCKIRTK